MVTASETTLIKIMDLNKEIKYIPLKCISKILIDKSICTK